MPTKGKKGQKTRGVFWRQDRSEWWIRWTCTLGHKHRRAQGPDKEQARRERSTKVLEVREARRAGRVCCPKMTPAERPARFSQLLDDYLRRRDLKARDEDERERRKRKEHARVEFLRARFGTHPVLAITTRDVEAMYEDLKARTVGQGDEKRPVAVATVNRYMKLLHAVLRLGVKRGLLLTNPAAPVELARENNARNRCLSDDEHARLMEALPGWFRPLVVVAMLTGMRRSELLRLRWSDVDVETGSVCVRRDKAGDGRWVVLNAEALETLRSLRRNRVLSSLVFTTPEGQGLHNNFKRYWHQARTKAKLEDFRFHDLRHTFASRLVRQGVSSYVVQHAGGWRTASMMARYAHLDPTTIRAAVELLTARPEPSSGANGHQNGHHRPNATGNRESRKAVSA
jgi:integrase